MSPSFPPTPLCTEPCGVISRAPAVLGGSSPKWWNPVTGPPKPPATPAGSEKNSSVRALIGEVTWRGRRSPRFIATSGTIGCGGRAFLGRARFRSGSNSGLGSPLGMVVARNGGGRLSLKGGGWVAPGGRGSQ